MLMPAIAFLFGCGFFAVVGAVVLRLVRRQGLGRKALLYFVPGAMVASAGAGWLYGILVADEHGQLHGGIAVAALFGALLVAGVAGGLGAVLLFSKRRVA